MSECKSIRDNGLQGEHMQWWHSGRKLLSRKGLKTLTNGGRRHRFILEHGACAAIGLLAGDRSLKTYRNAGLERLGSHSKKGVMGVHKVISDLIHIG